MINPGSVNNYRPVVLSQCTPFFNGSYTLLTQTGLDSYALLWNCTDTSCSQCTSQLTIALGVCTSDPYNGSYSFLLTDDNCFLAETNPETIPSTSVSMIFFGDTNSCTNSSFFDVVTYGSVSSTPVCVPSAFGSYIWLRQAGLGNYSGGHWCNQGCTYCNQTFTNVAMGSCFLDTVFANMSFSLTLTSSLTSCYEMPYTMYLSHINDP